MGARPRRRLVTRARWRLRADGRPGFLDRLPRHNSERVRLYIEESFTFLILTEQPPSRSAPRGRSASGADARDGRRSLRFAHDDSTRPEQQRWLEAQVAAGHFASLEQALRLPSRTLWQRSPMTWIGPSPLSTQHRKNSLA